jgi:putative MATE family efflux protein
MTITILYNRIGQFLSLIKRALKGEHHDYTSGSLRLAILLLAIPMILEMGMESVFAIVDIFFVGRLGKHAVSTVGLTESVLTIVYSIAIGISMAATAVVARRVGEKNNEGATRAAAQSILIGLALIAVTTTVGLVFAPQILRLMGAETETIQRGVNYTRILFASNVSIVLLFLINGIFRGAGNASIAMKSLGLANLCNIILCPLLINGWGPIPALGLTGAALATTIGRTTGVCYQVYHLFKGKGIVRLGLSSFRAEWDTMRSLIKVAWPATLQFVIASCSWIFMARLVAETGHSAASAGYQTALRIVTFFILPAWGVSNASATLVGQNLGAKQFGRAEDSVYATARYNVIFMLVVSVVFFVWAHPIVGLFARQEDVQAYAVDALRAISTGFVFYGIAMVMTSALNGAGDTRTPTIINFFCFWLFQIPLAYILVRHFKLGPEGVFYCIPIAETVVAITAFIVFRSGRWKKIVV